MPKVATCLWFEKDLEAAAKFYTSLVPNSSIDHTLHSPNKWAGGEAGEVILIELTLGGQAFQILNGGSPANYGTVASISVSCDGQAEVDQLWSALTADGGAEIACGWLRDKWGVPWQIIPAMLPPLLAHKDPAISRRVFNAMNQMIKLDVAALERAAAG